MVTIVVPFLIWGEVLEQGFSLSGVVTWLEAQGRFAWPATIADVTLPIPASAVKSARSASSLPEWSAMGSAVGLAGR